MHFACFESNETVFTVFSLVRVAIHDLSEHSSCRCGWFHIAGSEIRHSDVVAVSDRLENLFQARAEGANFTCEGSASATDSHFAERTRRSRELYRCSQHVRDFECPLSPHMLFY